MAEEKTMYMLHLNVERGLHARMKAEAALRGTTVSPLYNKIVKEWLVAQGYDDLVPQPVQEAAVND